jgi:hypothetical protein
VEIAGSLRRKAYITNKITFFDKSESAFLYFAWLFSLSIDYKKAVRYLDSMKIC